MDSIIKLHTYGTMIILYLDILFDKIIRKPITQALAAALMVCDAISSNTESGIGYNGI